MTPKNILIPTDFGLGAEHALDYACSLAAKLGATIHLVNALGAMLPELPVAVTGSTIEKITERHHAELAKLAEPRRILATIGQLLIKPGDARDAILEAIDEVHADLVVMGTHGRRGVGRLVLGSVAEDIARRAPCPVLLVRANKVGAP